MQELGGLICDLVIEKHGTEELLRRVADPFWFHSLSLATGFDWNSSGTTTVLLSALREYYNRSQDSGLFIAGGKGKGLASVRSILADKTREGIIDDNAGESIRLCARSIARVDNNLLQDGYDLYIQFVIVTGKGRWAIVQQGMNTEARMARRYHWHMDSFPERLNDGRNGISSQRVGNRTMDLSARISVENRADMVGLVSDDPHRHRHLFANGKQATLDNSFVDGKILRLDTRIDWPLLKRIYESQPTDFDQLIGLTGVGKSTIRAISMIASLVYGSEPSWKDPVRYSFALGGKDGIPKPVNYEDYDRCIDFYRELLGNLMHSDDRLSRIAENLNRNYGRITGNFL
jgi:hypothetical protein